MPASDTAFIEMTTRVLTALRRRAPRVQCLTNTVAQPITANALLALGARVSMATHPAEVIDMSRTADAVLINLGTLDHAREAAIPLLLANDQVRAKPMVLDPVFVEHSRLRLALATDVVARRGDLIVKGNLAEMEALDDALQARGADLTCVITGAVDCVRRGDERQFIGLGHAMMARVTGMGCAAGAIVAACYAVERDPLVASVAGLVLCGIAGQTAARSARAGGTGTFATAFIDALALIDADSIAHELSRYDLSRSRNPSPLDVVGPGLRGDDMGKK